MERPFRPILLGLAAAGILILSSTLSPAGAQTVPVKKVEAPIKALAPDVSRRLTTPTSREVILESIKSLPRPSARLNQAAPGTVSPPVKLQMRQGPGKGKPAATASAAGAAQIAGTSAGYDKIDWKAGVFISPFTVPKYGLANWPVAMLTTQYVEAMKTQDPGLVVLDWDHPYAGYTSYCAITAALELPEDAALYTIVLKIVRADGVCEESWVRDRTKCGAVPVVVYFSGSPVPMTKLIDNSGFVGIVNAEPGPEKDGSYYGMRGCNASIQINLMNWPDSMNEPVPRLNPLVFAGLTITRLQ